MNDGGDLRAIEIHSLIAVTFRFHPMRAIGAGAVKLRPGVEMTHVQPFGLCLSFPLYASEQDRAEGNIPHLQLQASLEAMVLTWDQDLLVSQTARAAGELPLSNHLQLNVLEGLTFPM